MVFYFDLSGKINARESDSESRHTDLHQVGWTLEMTINSVAAAAQRRDRPNTYS